MRVRLGPFAERVAAKKRREARRCWHEVCDGCLTAMVTFDGAPAKWREWREFDARPDDEQAKIRFIGRRMNTVDSPDTPDEDHYLAVGNRMWREEPAYAVHILRDFVESQSP